MTETTVGETLNFVLLTEDRGFSDLQPALASLANRLEPTLENDFRQLAGTFGYQDRFGKANDKILVFLDAAEGFEPSGAIAEHEGYIPGRTYMRLWTRGPIFAHHPKAIVEDGIKAQFAAELAEISTFASGLRRTRDVGCVSVRWRRILPRNGRAAAYARLLRRRRPPLTMEMIEPTRRSAG